MKLGERLLVALSRKTGEPDYAATEDYSGVADALDNLDRLFSGFTGRLTDKRVLDFGCGTGHQVVAMAERGARRVVGVDTNPAVLAEARSLATRHRVTDRVEFTANLDERFDDYFDLVISQHSMEHFPDPAGAVALMRRALRPGGLALITFSPPWYAPYGSHMHFFTRVPWVHLFFAEATVLRVRARFRSDGAMRYEDVEGGLNRMSVARFERIVRGSGFSVRERRYDCVKGLNFLASVPVFRELAVNRISCTLAKSGEGGQSRELAPTA